VPWPTSTRRCAWARDWRLPSPSGRVRQLRGDLDGAMLDCDKAARLDPRLASARAYRAAVWCDKGQPAKAFADCDEALRFDH
jgi:hypothetical protein